ncbi:MAG TPA: hypothetical protein VIN07_11810 [Flavipsychrobacter sp.]
MAAILFAKFRSYSIDELLNRLDEGYYQALDIVCNNARNCAAQLSVEPGHPSLSLYAGIYTALFDDVQRLLLFRKQVVIPYVQELLAKVEDGHNCTNCTGNCHMGHNAQLMTLLDSHKEIKDVLSAMHAATIPMYNDVEYPEGYRILRNEVAVIDTMLTELFYIEESSLIPKIIEAQKAINA